MDENTISLLDLIISIIQIVVVVGSVIWAAYRFSAESPHSPRIEFDVDATFLGPQNNYFPTQVVIIAQNRGLRVRKFPSISLLIRGIPAGAPIEEWPKYEPRLFLPDKIIDHAEVVFTENYSSVFVEPGVTQNMTYFCRLPVLYRFVSIRVEFRYDDERTHSTERLFETPVRD